LKDGVWGWSWDAQTTPFAQGSYKLTATLVDKAGNAFTQTGASAAKDLIIDTSGPTDSKGLAIVAMSVDSGVGSFSPLDPSRKDFKTNDNTPVFTGKLDTALPQGEKIALQLLKGTVVVDFGMAIVDSTGKGWSWTPNNPLPDATYTLKANVVDSAGNPALTGSVSQAVVIDTNGPTDGGDANLGLKTTTIAISTDTAANVPKNADFVTSDGGNKDGMANTDDDKLTFTGQLNNSFTQNGGKVLVKISDTAGQLISSAYVEPSTSAANTWSYVGNMMSATDQSFSVDITPSIFKKNSVSEENLNDGSVFIKNFAPSMNEFGTYQFGSGQVKVYNGGILDLGELKSEYAIGEFELKFWDQAGNLKVEKNDKIWRFENPANPSQLSDTDAGFLAPKNFIDKSVGAVGKRDVTSNFDMATLYDGIDNVADQAVANHIVLSNTTNVSLTLSMGDVLALGVTNSFSVADTDNARHKGQTQMLIDGQAGDTLNLDGWVNGLDLDWIGGQTSSNVPLTLGSEQYNVYTNVDLGLALFVDKDITVNVL
jgi:hypothetical protein